MNLTTAPDTHSSESFHREVAENIHVSNSSAAIPNQDLKLLLSIANIERIFVPCISILGLVGNLLSAITFLSKALRNSRCSPFLAARCINDMVFLLCLLFVWVSVTFDLNLVHVYGVCHSVIFVTFFSGFMAVWLCGCITFENYLLITNKLAARRWYIVKTPVVSIATLSAVGICVYVSSFWTADEKCYLNHEQIDLTKALAYIDILLTFVFPAAIIVALLILISVKVTKIMYEKRRRMSNITIASMNSTATSVTSPAARVTKMLLVYSILMFTLHCPSHAMTLFILIKMKINNTQVITANEAALRSGLQMLFHLGFTINFVIFYSLSQNFRKEFLKLFCCKKSKRTPRTDARPFKCQRRHTIEGILNVENGPDVLVELTSFLRTHRCSSQ